MSTNQITPLAQELTHEVQRRRTFAIISHPDAGKNHAHRKTIAVCWRGRTGRIGTRP